MTAADLDRFVRLDSLGLTVTGQQIFPDHAVLFCQVTVADDRCPGCGQSGSRHDTVLRRFTHLPLGHRPTWLEVATPRYSCDRCHRVWRHRLRSVARTRSRLTRAAGMWALAAVVLDHVAVSSVARVLGEYDNPIWTHPAPSVETAHRGPASTEGGVISDTPVNLGPSILPCSVSPAGSTVSKVDFRTVILV